MGTAAAGQWQKRREETVAEPWWLTNSLESSKPITTRAGLLARPALEEQLLKRSGHLGDPQGERERAATRPRDITPASQRPVGQESTHTLSPSTVDNLRKVECQFPIAPVTNYHKQSKCSDFQQYRLRVLKVTSPKYVSLS